MEKKPNSGGDYVVITVRLPIKLLARLSRWLLVAGSMYVLLRHKPTAGGEGSRPSRLEVILGSAAGSYAKMQHF